MKKLFLIFLATVAIVSRFVFLQDFAWAVESASGSKVIAYYFHGNVRCVTCHKLEKYSKDAIESNFKDDLASGRLVFQAVNIDEKDNKHFVKDYQLYTKALVLSLVKDGKEVRSKNLSKIWEYVGNQQRFYEYVYVEVGDFLKEL